MPAERQGMAAQPANRHQAADGRGSAPPGHQAPLYAVVAERLARLGADLGLGIAVIAGVLDPEVVVLGGYFVPLLDHLLPTARAVLDERLGSRAQVRPELRGSRLGVHAAALGAAEQALDRLFLAGEVPS